MWHQHYEWPVLQYGQSLDQCSHCTLSALSHRLVTATARTPLLAQTLSEPIWSSMPSRFSLHLCGIYQCTLCISLHCMLQDPEWIKIMVILLMTADVQGPQKLIKALQSAGSDACSSLYHWQSILWLPPVRFGTVFCLSEVVVAVSL